MNSAVRASLTTVIAIGVVLAWLYFAPAFLGGQVTLVVTQGSSMEPLLTEGDLAVLRTSDDVQIGDVFGYEDQSIAQNVVHRVVDYRVTAAGVRYVLQGDNNTWLDPEQPTGEDLIGKLWFEIPGAGRVVQWIREPLHGGPIAGLVAAIVAARYRLANKAGRVPR
ncbi:MAG: signal peptidase I, partial [Chloroflexota bacterium]